MIEYNCREACLSDLEELVEMTSLLASETEDRALPHDTVKSGIKALIENPPKTANFKGIILVAERKPSMRNEDNLLGFLSVAGFEWSEWRNGMFIWLGSAYVRQEFRKSGVGSVLYRKAKQYAEQCGAIGLRAYIDKSNSPGEKAHKAVGQLQTNYILTENLFDVK
jgi:GNAT superfamily N-acetyltransferase